MWYKLPNYYLYIDIWQWNAPQTNSTITGAIDRITFGNDEGVVDHACVCLLQIPLAHFTGKSENA